MPSNADLCRACGKRPVKNRGLCNACKQYLAKCPDTTRGRAIAAARLPATTGKNARRHSADPAAPAAAQTPAMPAARMTRGPQRRGVVQITPEDFDRLAAVLGIEVVQHSRGRILFVDDRVAIMTPEGDLLTGRVGPGL